MGLQMLDRGETSFRQPGCEGVAEVMDWHSRKVLSWLLSNTVDTNYYYAAALGEALARCGVPDIFNTDQGFQFTSFEFTQVLKYLLR